MFSPLRPTHEKHYCIPCNTIVVMLFCILTFATKELSAQNSSLFHRPVAQFGQASSPGTNGEVLPATALYKGIVARDHKAGVPRVAEQIKASLRLAALASAAGRKAESEAIFAELGLSPDQCSIYQSKPAMLSFKHPDYSGAMLRAESEGRVQFEFDLDQAGAP